MKKSVLIPDENIGLQKQGCYNCPWLSHHGEGIKVEYEAALTDAELAKLTKIRQWRQQDENKI